MQAYMSPYMQNVVDFQKTQAVSDYGRQLPGQQAAASRAGAFGGSRQAIVESEAQRNLQNTLGGIQAQGSQQAFEQANKNLQFGSQLGLQGLGLAGQMGQQLGQLGQTAFGQQAAAAQAQQAAGATQQAQSQDILNKRYEDFMQQQTFPQSQLQFYSSLLRGVPVSPNQTMYQYQAPASAASQVAGLGMGALGLSRAFGAKDGGVVPGYAEGGITGGPEGQPTTLEVSKIKTALLKGADPRSFPPSIALLLAVSDPRVKDAIDTREGARVQAALDQGRQNAQLPSIMEEQIGGIAGLDMGAMEDAEYGGGGIIAFNGGGAAFSAQDILPEDLEEGRRQGRSPYTPESAKERADRLRALRQQARPAFGASPGAGISAVPASTAVPAGGTPSLLSRGLGALGRVAARGAGGAGLMLESSEAGAGSDVVSGKPAGRPPTQQEIERMLERGEISDAKARELLKRPLTATPQSQYNAQDIQEGGRGQSAPTAAPKPAEARTAAPATATTTPPGTPQAPPSLLYTGKSPEQAFADREAEMERRFPSEKNARLAEIKEQAASAVKERDADRWMAVAMGGFSMAANAKPGARGLGGFLGDLGAGLQLTTKELAGVNKEFRKGQALRTAAEREERKADRLESMQKYDAADKARTRVEDIKRGADQADAMYKATLEGLAIKKTAVEVERDKVRATREGTSAYREAALESRNITAFNGAVQKEKDLLSKSISMMTATPEQLEQQAIRNVIARNPQFAGLAGVSAADTFAQPPLPKGVKVTRE
jgi:hypothetical protein